MTSTMAYYESGPETCRLCQGDGWLADSTVGFSFHSTCEDCDGTGAVEVLRIPKLATGWIGWATALLSATELETLYVMAPK